MQEEQNSFGRPSMPFYDFLMFFVSLGEMGRKLMAWYGQIAAMIFLIAFLEACIFGFRHFLKIRDASQEGCHFRLGPQKFAQITQNSGVMRVGEPVLVSMVIMGLGIFLALIWPLWLPFVAGVVGYDVVQYLIRKFGSRKEKKRGKKN